MVQAAFPAVSVARSRKALREATYYHLKDKYAVASQLIIETTGYVWCQRKTLMQKPNRYSVRFDTRLFSFKQTARGNSMLSLQLNHQRVGLDSHRDKVTSLNLAKRVNWDFGEKSVVQGSPLGIAAVNQRACWEDGGSATLAVEDPEFQTPEVILGH